ncbi:pimeloyl-ACP methyl ester carboxylesterase [Cytobacillus eiseniae]|uniref:Pimeloyl-ACP methyl ester carboxylesterase n=1 Tax=Cytobacillus eiseniae TaxID=762947 RepID=A0ABS4RE34_9BACI|nr:alpha/beta hydrolase [Cytobacillus eiseniae]MBP2241156.1 pimeloyl-ACP methyl ester carboxylesterase [Cytobacillus eiseniae]
MESRNFQLDAEWNMIHYPEKPSGFGILILGDERNFVHADGSFWTQNEGKSLLLNKCKDEGYTIFYSNLYGKSWGNAKAVNLARRLYEHIIRTEIINERVHLIAEGMGALVALKLLNEMGPSQIRACVLINPILSLHDHLELEREHKFYYKKLIKELSVSLDTDTAELETITKGMNEYDIIENNDIPMKIIQVLYDRRAYKQANLLKKLTVTRKENEMPLSICYILPEKRNQIDGQILNFLKQYERIL